MAGRRELRSPIHPVYREVGGKDSLEQGEMKGIGEKIRTHERRGKVDSTV
jgi:hypothetical protein